MGECGGGAGGWIRLVSEIHGCDEAGVHGEDVENFAVGEDIARKALDELVDPNAELASVFLGDCQWFDMGVELSPLAGPIGADRFFADDLAAFGGFGSAHVGRHQR